MYGHHAILLLCYFFRGDIESSRTICKVCINQVEGSRNDIYRNPGFLCGMFHIEETDRKLSFCFPFYDDCSLLLLFLWPILDCRWNSDFYPFRRASTRRRQFFVFCRYPMFNAKYGFIFDIIGAICIFVGLFKVFS